MEKWLEFVELPLLYRSSFFIFGGKAYVNSKTEAQDPFVSFSYAMFFVSLSVKTLLLQSAVQPFDGISKSCTCVYRVCV